MAFGPAVLFFLWEVIVIDALFVKLLFETTQVKGVIRLKESVSSIVDVEEFIFDADVTNSQEYSLFCVVGMTVGYRKELLEKPPSLLLLLLELLLELLLGAEERLPDELFILELAEVDELLDEEELGFFLFFPLTTSFSSAVFAATSFLNASACICKVF